MKYVKSVAAILIAATLFLCGCGTFDVVAASAKTIETKQNTKDVDASDHFEDPLLTIDDIPEFDGDSIIEINDDEPFFTEKEKHTLKTFEEYSDLDPLGRCGVAYANISEDTMPDEARGPIGSVKPSGWHTVKYNDIIDGNYAFNRCHLIAFCLAGENVNEENLITGFRYFNTPLMTEYETMVLDYVRDTDNHVLYRVTPVFADDELVARGVEMEGWSVEDNGKGICFHVFIYNVQPGIGIDYATGETWEDDTMVVDGMTDTVSSAKPIGAAEYTYVLNANTKKIHAPACSSVKQMAEHNKIYSNESLETLIMEGYEPCGNCHAQ